MAKKKQVTEAQGTEFTVFLDINNEKYTSTSDSFDTAILNLPAVTPKTKATIVVSSEGKESKPIILKIPQFKQLFFGGLTGSVSRIALEKRYKMLS